MDYKTVQQKLNDLGQNPPLVVDGSYGPKSRSAVISFQQTHGLSPDGVVGPKTLAALGLSSSSTVPSSGSSGAASTMGSTVSPGDVAAYAVAKRAAPNMPEKQLQYALAVARGEGGFGQGWGRPSAATIAKSEQFGLTGYEGAGSNNWGATQGQGDAGSFPHVDSHADGSLYVGNYRKWSSPEKGFLDVANIILGGGKRGAAGSAEIKKAIDSGKLRDAVYAQHANGYFELNPEQYLSAVLRNYNALAASTGWKGTSLPSTT
jgi:peptidoglycan hydrolase-like protein with peptidoglycan-binding domain